MNLTELINKIDKLKAEIDTLRPIKSDQEARIMQKFRLDWNYHSNAIEGNSLSLGETRAFLLHGITAQGKPFKDYLDIKGHNEAIAHLEAFVRGKQPLTEADIRHLHEILLVEPYEVDARTPDSRPTKRLIAIGQYKTMPNHVETSTGETHFYALPEETPAKMGDLMAWYQEQSELGELHPLILAATFHYQFVAIHPFDDGNGRMARLLTNLILMRNGYVPVIIKIEAKAEYLFALEKADVGELEDFIILVGEALANSPDLFLRGARGESIEELEDLDKKIALLQQRLEPEKTKAIQKEEGLLQKRLRLFESLIIPLSKDLQSDLRKFERLFDNKLSSQPSYRRYNVIHGMNLDQTNQLFEDTKSDIAVSEIYIEYQLKSFIADKSISLSLTTSTKFADEYFAIHYTLADLTQRYIVDHELIKENYNDIYTEEKVSELSRTIANQVYQLIKQQADNIAES